jgi:hypothetical protein
MHQASRFIALAVLAAALASLLAHAAPPATDEPRDEPSADLLPSAKQRMLSKTASQAALPIATAAAPTIEEVGDVDSFGRAVKWLGVAQMNVALTDACPLPGDDTTACAVLNPAPAATAFSFEDVARITLPGKAANSLLCHWLSPVLDIDYANPTAIAAIARLSYQPTLTVESEVLEDPALIDPTTGLPFGGRLLTSMTASERFEVPLEAGQVLGERTRDSAVCIAGFLSKRALVGTYGLTESQAKEFFKKKITVRMNVSGNAQYVGNASLMFGFRIVGD